MGTVIKAFLTGCWRYMTPYLVMRKTMEPNAPARRGANTQARNTWTTPELMLPPHQWMPSAPTAAIPIPMTPPMIECVVDTGIPNRVATVR